ncbi:unnamed protein product [Diatraea saccharalis]|uniref:Uncharacterized protein n=1 Tax=Diatraea saccharalis TaxID=40085 RepID=A0A9N9RAL8_9NEOP|nr:unnamed protein product [Diatraea saccharalis]
MGDFISTIILSPEIPSGDALRNRIVTIGVAKPLPCSTVVGGEKANGHSVQNSQKLEYFTKILRLIMSLHRDILELQLQRAQDVEPAPADAAAVPGAAEDKGGDHYEMTQRPTQLRGHRRDTGHCQLHRPRFHHM